MSNVKMSDVIMSAVELVLSRGGDVMTEDGDFATCGTDEIIRLDTSIAELLELPSDDVDIRDIDLILAKAKAYDSNQELISKLQADNESLHKLVEYDTKAIFDADDLNIKLQADNELLRRNAEGMIDAVDSFYADDPEFSSAYYILKEALAATAKG